MSNRIFNENKPGKYYWQTANIVDDLGLSAYAFRLYCHLVRVSSIDNVDIATRKLSEACRMSTGQVTNAKNELVTVGLISIAEIPSKRGHPAHEITILDITARNVEHCQAPHREYVSSPHELINSPHELIVPQDELISSPHEPISSRGETPINNTQKQEQEHRSTGAGAPTPAPKARDSLFDAIAEVTSSNPHLQGPHIAKTTNALRKIGATPEQVKQVAAWYVENDWRGRKGEQLTLPVLVQVWDSGIKGAPVLSTNGNHAPKESSGEIAMRHLAEKYGNGKPN